MRIDSRKLAGTICLVLSSACGGGDFLAPAAAPPETYLLRTFNGGALPVTLSTDSRGNVDLLDDQIQLNMDGSYVETGHLRSTANGAASVQELNSPGTYTRSGSTITLVSSSGTIVGSFTEANALTILAGSNTLIFRR